MHRSLMAHLGLTVAALVAALVLATASAEQPQPAAGQPGVLITDEEFCAFRAPLALTGAGEVPANCAETVAWLQRLAEHDPVCYALWVQISATPACALPHRSAAP